MAGGHLAPWASATRLGAGPSSVQGAAASELRQRPGSSLPVPGLTSSRVPGAPCWLAPTSWLSDALRPQGRWAAPCHVDGPACRPLPRDHGPVTPPHPLGGPWAWGLTSPDSQGLCLLLGPLGAGRQVRAQAGGGREAPAEGLRASAGCVGLQLSHRSGQDTSVTTGEFQGTNS